jgi:hypothetical protein
MRFNSAKFTVFAAKMSKNKQIRTICRYGSTKHPANRRKQLSNKPTG